MEGQRTAVLDTQDGGRQFSLQSAAGGCALGRSPARPLRSEHQRALGQKHVG